MPYQTVDVFDFELASLPAQPVCGGRRFKRHFNKRDFPILGEDDKVDPNPIVLSGRSRSLVPKSLSLTVTQVRSWYFDPQTGKWRWPLNGADQVYPGIFLGDSSTAMCLRLLKDLGVTAVLNAAQGEMTDWNYVNTKESYYKGKGIRFFGVPAIDLKHYPINAHFVEASDFIDSVIKAKGCVLVHCVQGISRSASLILAYLMVRKKMTLKQAVDTVRSKRSIGPNEGFTEQLIELNDSVHGLDKKQTTRNV